MFPQELIMVGAQLGHEADVAGDPGREQQDAETHQHGPGLMTGPPPAPGARPP